MKTLHLLMICAILILSSPLLAYATMYGGHLGPVSGDMLFMKSNSNATIKINYLVNYPHNKTISTGIEIYDARAQYSEPMASSDLTVGAEPASIDLMKNNTVTYTITAKNNVKGVYAMSLYSSCGKSPLVVGLNESDVLPSALFRFAMPYHCGVISGEVSKEIIGYNGITSKTVFIPQDRFSPLEQIQLGSNTTDVQCKQGLDLIIRTNDNTPACVKPDTASKLVERGWALIYANMVDKESISLSAYQGVSNEAFYNNGTVASNFTIDVNINNFKPSNASLVLQVYYNNGMPYKTVSVPSDEIQSDGFYKYLLIAVSDKNHSAPFKVVATYNKETAITYAPVFAHP